ncbi:MAG TPA: hypothetical protein VNL15_05290, partial [Dehalococcoidia bacterium]|nr:hypothetical protein [Dehalococcoidia bacterium]
MDITKLPLGGLILGGLATVLALTFAIAFALTVETGEEPADGGGTATPPPGGADFVIKMIPTLKFDKNTLTIPANQEVVVEAVNEDGALPHNFAVYRSKSEAG